MKKSTPFPSFGAVLNKSIQYFLSHQLQISIMANTKTTSGNWSIKDLKYGSVFHSFNTHLIKCGLRHRVILDRKFMSDRLNLTKYIGQFDGRAQLVLHHVVMFLLKSAAGEHGVYVPFHRLQVRISATDSDQYGITITKSVKHTNSLLVTVTFHNTTVRAETFESVLVFLSYKPFQWL